MNINTLINIFIKFPSIKFFMFLDINNFTVLFTVCTVTLYCNTARCEDLISNALFTVKYLTLMRESPFKIE